MSARGFNLAQEAHPVLVLAPGSVSGGVSGQVFSMQRAAKCNIALAWGTAVAGQGAVTVSACSDLAGDNAVPIGFDLYQQAASGPGNDVYGSRQAVSSTGYFSAVSGTVDIIEVQADQLPDNLPYLKLSIADGVNAESASAIAFLTGYRYQCDGTASATV